MEKNPVSEQQQYFHFTLGPVQGFVAQARRTRDFWAGSFLLSWLAGVAMVAVKKQNGQINFPLPPASYLDWIQGQASSGEPPRQGAIPNRFKSICAQVPVGFDPHAVVAAVKEAWQALAQHVWVQDGLDGLAAAGTRAIWERQHAHFWDVTWAITDDEQDTSLLDQRKNWRSHGFEQHEPGVKCMVMDGWQELSGQARPGAALRGFWDTLRHARAAGMASDLGPGEQLCALAYVKRRFTRHFAGFTATLPTSGVSLQGWPLSHGMPSVSYMAAVHWLEQLLKAGQDAEVATLLEAAQAVGDERVEWDTHIRCLRQAADERRWHAGNPKRQLLALDGQLFFRHVQEQPKAYDPDRMRELRRALGAFCKAHPELDAAPSPYYAILLMDGDSLGEHMSDVSKQQAISKGLEAFTTGVPGIVDEHNGCLIYAGGDDVLAILPLEDALRCAARVRQRYLACFDAQEPKISTTISAAVAFAHVKTPLGMVLADLHPLLDDVAKDGAGRDSVAVRVWKTSGQVLQWAQPWKIALHNVEQRADGGLEVETLARLFAKDGRTGAEAEGATLGDGRFSNKFFFKIEERLAVLAAPRLVKPAAGANGVLSEDELLDLLAVDFWHSDTNRERIRLGDAREHIKPLLTQCRPRQRVVLAGKEAPVDDWPPQALAADGAMLVRFLATKGLEGEAQ